MKAVADGLFVLLVISVTSWFTEDMPEVTQEKENYMIDYDLLTAENRSRLLESSSMVKDAYLEIHLDSIKKLNKK